MVAVVALLLTLALVGSRLFVVVGVATAACFLTFTDYTDAALQLDRIVTKVESLTGKNVFLSIPFFVAAGAVLTRGGVARRLTDLAREATAWLPGGLAIASIAACIVFAAISGSSPVTLVAVGSVMVPALIASGYPPRFAVGLVCAAGSLGCMIPPAISMLVYAISVQGTAAVEPADLFLAGLIPALGIAGLLAVYAAFVGSRVPGSRRPIDMARLWTAFREAAWALTLPALVLGGIYGGAFTPTEAGAVAFVASLVLATWVYGDVGPSDIPALLAEAATLIGSLILLVVLAFGLNDFLAEIDAPARLQTWVTDANLSSWQFMLLVNGVLIVLGALMDSMSATLVFAPIFAPVAIEAYGIDPLHFGVVFVVNMEIGYIAPPVATNLFVAAAIFRMPFGEVAKAILPTLGIVTAALVVLIYVPTLSLGLVNWRDGEPIVADFPWERPAPEAPAPAPTGKRPLTLQELMESARRNAAEPSPPTPPPE